LAFCGRIYLVLAFTLLRHSGISGLSALDAEITVLPFGAILVRQAALFQHGETVTEIVAVFDDADLVVGAVGIIGAARGGIFLILAEAGRRSSSPVSGISLFGAEIAVLSVGTILVGLAGRFNVLILASAGINVADLLV
jgi:hypothetical protein